MNAEDTVRKTIDAFNSHDTMALSQNYADDAQAYDPQYPEPIHGPEAIREDLDDFFRAFPDMRCEIDSMMTSGDTVSFDGIMRGTHQGPMAGPQREIAATGRQVEIPVALFLKVGSDGRILEERRFYDIATMLTQLGVMQAEAGAAPA